MALSPLERLSEASGREFPNLLAARAATREGLASRRHDLSELQADDDVAVVLMGSWGRAEVTRGSDDDFMVLVRDGERDEVRPSIEDVAQILDESPGSEGAFGKRVASEHLVQRIGLPEDSNDNLTRRMLLLLESVSVAGHDIHEAVRTELADRYLDESVKDYRPPRFLLNDVIRYWRTICVDFAGKEYKGPEKWGIRNAKLRTSRKVLFASGLLPVFECARYTADDMRGFLKEQLSQPPSDRIAQSFLDHDAADLGGRALGAYDEFVGLLNDHTFRGELSAVTRDTAARSEAFQHAARLGKELERGMLALLFETDELSKLARDYVVF